MGSALRAFLGNVGFLELQYLNPSCDQIYAQFCKSKQLKPEYEVSDSGVNGFWLGSKSAQCIIIHFHAGGYALDITPNHFGVWFRIIQEMAQQGVDIAVFFPVYTLTTQASYPTQFTEGVSALNHIVDKLGRDPSEIILSGDSAGGNMCLAIMSHMMHPCPEITEKAVKTNWASMKKNVYRGTDNTGTMAKMARSYMNGRDTDNYIEPALAPIDWWTKCPVKETFAVAGEDEVLIDPIKVWAERFQAAGNKTRFVVAPREFHIELFTLPMFGIDRETIMEQEMKAWLFSIAK
ncbi:unnamed protein product [Clonostachys solani]|uniref:Alpha/beta hydrolase fold-3 domain-containing protein n=1 Tax=Clonostachys solani TaxID=160281 RepID=A0A9N9YZX5_9HYPO|nr:unnamed protein product [Clonostachys solani]